MSDRNIVLALPNDLLGHILDFLHDGRDLSRCYGVCSQWRNFLLTEDLEQHSLHLENSNDKASAKVVGEERWKRLCITHGFPLTLTQALEKKVGKYSKERIPQTTNPGIRTIAKANFAYKDHYLKYRDRICRCCRVVKSQHLHYPLEHKGKSGITYPLCSRCRRDVCPFALLTMTEVKKQFKKFGIDNLSVPFDHNLDHMDVATGNSSSPVGYLFRFMDILDLAKSLVAQGRNDHKRDIDYENCHPTKKRKRKAISPPSTADVDRLHEYHRGRARVDVSNPDVFRKTMLHLY